MPVEAARKRVKALIALPEAQRLAKAAELRGLAKVVEAGELPDFLKDDEDASEDKKDDEAMEKEALKTVFRAALAALEAGENDEKYKMPAEPEKRLEKQEELEKEAGADRKQMVLAHLAKLRMQKEATVDGKSMSTPKEVPSPDGSVEDQLSGDAKVQYSPATADRPISTIETKKQKLPADKAHGDEAEMYFGNNPKAKEEIQTEKDSSKGVNNKRELADMGTAVYSSEPKSPTEHMESGSGSHQKTKDWETAKSESDKTPTGSRLVGLASAERAVKLARLAQSKGMIANEDQFDEMVTRYASYDDNKFAMACEIVEEAPAISAKAATRKVAQETVFSDNEAVEDEGNVDEKVPASKKEAILQAAKERAEALGIKRTGGLQVPIVSIGDRPMTAEISNPRFAALADPELFPWDGPTAKFYEAERRGTLDSKHG